MIFVIMGMEVHPFDRLARAVDELEKTGAIGEDFFVQLGSCSFEPVHARFERYLSFGEVRENVRKASVVVTHAGAGSTLLCIQQEKLPIVVPRRSRLGEHVDEHQVQFAERLDRTGLATAVYDVGELGGAIHSVRTRRGQGGHVGQAKELTRWLDGFWRDIAGRRPH